jgi:hypothetical protein
MHQKGCQNVSMKRLHQVSGSMCELTASVIPWKPEKLSFSTSQPANKFLSSPLNALNPHLKPATQTNQTTSTPKIFLPKVAYQFPSIR